MTVMEQMGTAKQVKDFLSIFGLKQKYVAQMCGIPERSFSRFVTSQLALSEKQLMRITDYMTDYVRRNS